MAALLGYNKLVLECFYRGMDMKKITILDIAAMKAEGRKIPVLTAYGFQTAAMLDGAGIPMIIVGDSVGMVEAGYETTLPVTLDEMVYHTRSVARGARRALIVGDMPFGSYQTSPADACRNAARLVKEGFAGAVKMEGGVRVIDAVRAVIDMDVPVMGHIGLTPQSVHRMGGYRVQGKGRSQAREILKDAKALEDAGVFSIVIEGVPTELAKEITAALKIPTIGIGAGPHCNGQVLVVNDMLGLTPFEGRAPKYLKKYAELAGVVTNSVKDYIKDVEDGTFPTKEHSY